MSLAPRTFSVAPQSSSEHFQNRPSSRIFMVSFLQAQHFMLPSFLLESGLNSRPDQLNLVSRYVGKYIFYAFARDWRQAL